MNPNKQAERRRYRSAQEWAEIVSRWRKSGQSAEDYASKHNLGVGNLYRWSGRIGEQSLAGGAWHEKVGAPVPAPRFLPVSVAKAVQSERPTAIAQGGIEILWPGGPVVCLPCDVSQATLAMVLRELAGVTPC